jgi:hypothetical protein
MIAEMKLCTVQYCDFESFRSFASSADLTDLIDLIQRFQLKKLSAVAAFSSVTPHAKNPGFQDYSGGGIVFIQGPGGLPLLG